jgi:hypothetical protein
VDILECDSSLWPTTLEDVESHIDKIPVHCKNTALMRVLVSALGIAVKEYNSVKKDYNDKVSDQGR